MMQKLGRRLIKPVLVGVLAVILCLPGFLPVSVRAESRNVNAPENATAETGIKDINQKVAELQKSNMTLEAAVKIFGNPKQYLWEGKTYTKDQLPDNYIAEIENGFCLMMNRNHINEIRFEAADESLTDTTGYAYKDTIKIGTPMDAAMKVLKSPQKTVEGKAPGLLEDGVLYKDINGEKGKCYYRLGEQGITIFFWEEKVSAMYLSTPIHSTQSYKPKAFTSLSPANRITITKHPLVADYSFKQQGKLKVFRAYDPKAEIQDCIDIRHQDLSDLDLSKRIDDLKHTAFDTDTIWPAKMPKEFDPKKVMEIGMNPGLGIRQLQKAGITGKGVNIGMIDQTLLIEHMEYKNRVRMYEEIHSYGEAAAMHGPSMASIAVGKNLGVAPGADLYFIATSNYNITSENKNDLDFTYDAQAIDRMLKINELLPKGDKIRVISLSASFCPQNNGYKELTEAIGRAKKAGIFVVSCNLFETYGYKYWYQGLDRDPLDDPEKIASYSVYPWKNWISQIHHITGTDTYYEKEFNKYQPKEILLVPMSSKTFASPTGAGKYSFERCGGWSSVEPYLAGLYAMACQVKPDITPELFLSQMLETGDTKAFSQNDNNYTGKMINPERLMESLKKIK